MRQEGRIFPAAEDDSKDESEEVSLGASCRMGETVLRDDGMNISHDVAPEEREGREELEMDWQWDNRQYHSVSSWPT